MRVGGAAYRRSPTNIWSRLKPGKTGPLKDDNAPQRCHYVPKEKRKVRQKLRPPVDSFLRTGQRNPLYRASESSPWIWPTGTGTPFVNGQVCLPMDLPDAQTLTALALVITAVGGVIGALATLIWNLRRKP